MITVHRPSYTDKVDVYWNATRKCFSIRLKLTGKVCDYTDRILIDRPEFIVDEGARQRIIRTNKMEPFAWVSGTVLGYRSRITDQGLPPLGVWSHRELCLRNVICDPYRYNMFVRMDKTFEPVVMAERTLLSIWGNEEHASPKIAVYRDDMWGEFSPMTKQCYDVMGEAGWAHVPVNSPLKAGYDEMERAGILHSRVAGLDFIDYFWEDQI